MTSITSTVIDTMYAEQDTLIITDPCYIMYDEDWEHYCNVMSKVSLKELLQDNHDFGDVLASDTGIGDWVNAVYNPYTNEQLGQFAADAGMVVCVKASDLMQYYEDDKEMVAELQSLIERGLATSIPDYTGKVDLLEVSTEGSWNKYVVLKGHGNSDKETWTTEDME